MSVVFVIAIFYLAALITNHIFPSALNVTVPNFTLNISNRKLITGLRYREGLLVMQIGLFTGVSILRILRF